MRENWLMFSLDAMAWRDLTSPSFDNRLSTRREAAGASPHVWARAHFR